jgi:hypothetical protein
MCSNDLGGVGAVTLCTLVPGQTPTTPAQCSSLSPAASLLASPLAITHPSSAVRAGDAAHVRVGCSHSGDPLLSHPKRPPRPRPSSEPSVRADLPAPHPGASGRPGVRSPRRCCCVLPAPLRAASPPAANFTRTTGYPAACQSCLQPACQSASPGIPAGLRPAPAPGGSRGRGAARGHVPGPAPPWARCGAHPRFPGPDLLGMVAPGPWARGVGLEPIPSSRSQNGSQPLPADCSLQSLPHASSLGHPC